MSQEDSNLVYVIGDPQGPQKIGITRGLQSRLASLQTALYYRIQASFCLRSDKAYLIERAAHQALQAHAAQGEWFDVDPLEARNAIIAAAAVLDYQASVVELAPQREPLLVLSDGLIDGRQCRAARTWLKMEARELGQAIGINGATLRRFEIENVNTNIKTRRAARKYLELRGAMFVFTDEGEPYGIELPTREQPLVALAAAPHSKAPRQAVVATASPNTTALLKAAEVAALQQEVADLRRRAGLPAYPTDDDDDSKFDF